jgi:hypothetical protein
MQFAIANPIAANYEVHRLTECKFLRNKAMFFFSNYTSPAEHRAAVDIDYFAGDVSSQLRSEK